MEVPYLQYHTALIEFRISRITTQIIHGNTLSAQPWQELAAPAPYRRHETELISLISTFYTCTFKARQFYA